MLERFVATPLDLFATTVLVAIMNANTMQFQNGGAQISDLVLVNVLARSVLWITKLPDLKRRKSARRLVTMKEV